MIIVSQDKAEIINFDNVESIWVCKDADDGITIEATGTTNSTLGFYTTEERAKEVLQEISSTFAIKGVRNANYQCADIWIKMRQHAIYEMPKE